MITTKNLKVSDLHLNNGQVKGLPKNPRFIKDSRFQALKKSISDAPEMLGLREVVAYDNDGELVVIMGNMRLRACKDLGYKEVPCKVLPKSTPVAKLREYSVKDNISFGQNDWDAFANEWEMKELSEWGLETWEMKVTEFDTQGGGEYPAPNADDAMAHIGQGDTIYHSTPDMENIDPSVLPPELQGIDLSPATLPKIEGRDETLMERIIIVYPKDEQSKVSKLLGLTEITKVVYTIDEIIPE